MPHINTGSQCIRLSKDYKRKVKITPCIRTFNGKPISEIIIKKGEDGKWWIRVAEGQWIVNNGDPAKTLDYIAENLEF
jgi:hypothetical protein